MAWIQYGGGLRLMELVRLGANDVDEVRGIVTENGVRVRNVRHDIC
jgi:integrase